MYNILRAYVEAYRNTVHVYWGKIKRLCLFKDRVSHRAVWDLPAVSHLQHLHTNHHALKNGLPVHWIFNSSIKQKRNNTIGITAVIFLLEGLVLPIRNSYFVSQILKPGTNLWISCLLSEALCHYANMHIAKWPLWLNLDDHLRKNCQSHLVSPKSLSVHLRILVTLECYPRYMNN